MPARNLFQHQSYPPVPALEPQLVRLTLDPDPAAPPDFSRLHTEFGVRYIELVHGTFAGDDPLGISAWLQAGFARSSESTRTATSGLFASFAGSIRSATTRLTAGVAQFTEEFRARFSELVGDDPPVVRIDPAWTGENHHLARARLAVSLLCRLEEVRTHGSLGRADRLLLWGHSHAGNGFALLSNLLANDRGKVTEFFEAAGALLGPDGERARQILSAVDGPHPLAGMLLVVTFGTPVRYGWDMTGLRHLMHVTHHRPVDADAPVRATPAITVGCGEDLSLSWFTSRARDILFARQGDWVQLFGLAGTDLEPTVGTAENARLTTLLEQGLEGELPKKLNERFRFLCPRWQSAPRCHADGRNLLVEFDPPAETPRGPKVDTLLGHAIYTSSAWLPAQLNLVMQWLKADGAAPG